MIGRDTILSNKAIWTALNLPAPTVVSPKFWSTPFPRDNVHVQIASSQFLVPDLLT
jgi:hypothetical protein